MIWTPDKIETLKGYLADGESYRKIGQKFACSKDAIQHAVDRYNLNQFRAENPKAEKILQSIEIEELNDEKFEELKEQAKLKWIPVKTKISKNIKKPYEIALITSDHHVPHQDDPAIKAILKLMDDIKFDYNIILGDFLSCDCISHWNQSKHKTLELQRLKKDYILGNSLLDEMDKRLPKNCKKHFFFGNHDGTWIDDLLESVPALEGLVEPASQLFLTERGYKTYKYNDVVAFGRLNLTHGIFACSNPIKKHLDELKVNIAFGHTHQLGMMFSSSAAREIAFAGYNTGCLCNMAPDYLKGKPHAWTHGFMIVYFYPDGYFDVNLIRIIKGKFIYNEKIYNGNL